MRYCDCLLHHHLGRGNTQHLLVGIQALGSGHRQLARQVGAVCVTFSLFLPFDLQEWRTDPTHTLWAFRIRFQRDARSRSEVLSSEQPATVTSCGSSRPDATPSPRLHQPGTTGARVSVCDKHARSGVARHATAPPRGSRLACRNSASRPTGPPFRHHVPRRRLRRRHQHLPRHQCLPGGA